jgi:hypothetical protein
MRFRRRRRYGKAMSQCGLRAVRELDISPGRGTDGPESRGTSFAIASNWCLKTCVIAFLDVPRKQGGMSTRWRFQSVHGGASCVRKCRTETKTSPQARQWQVFVAFRLQTPTGPGCAGRKQILPRQAPHGPLLSYAHTHPPALLRIRPKRSKNCYESWRSARFSRETHGFRNRFCPPTATVLRVT